MAYKTLVANPSPLVRETVEFLQQMTQQMGDFALAMLLQSESGLSDKWNLVLSAPWIDREGLGATIPTITTSLLKHLSKVNAHKLDRVSVLPTSDPLVGMMAEHSIPLGEVYLVPEFWARREYGVQAGLPQLEDAIVLVAEQPSIQRPTHTTRA
ncbi:MAG: hypothetical protein WAN60_04625 [Candidatus Sulfotelmatobacter sp.]